MAKKSDNTYDSITTIEGLAAIRLRPGMYVGSTTSVDGEVPRALTQLAQEIISNAADEALNGYGDRVQLEINKDNSISVSDHGRGIPPGKDFDDIIRAATVMHSSGKFDSESYNTSAGQNGIGLKATTALSKWLRVDAVTVNGEAYSISFEQETVTDKSIRKAKRGEKTGTTITFLPDDDIFTTTNWNAKQLAHKLDELAYITPGVTYGLKDNRPEEVVDVSFHHPNGMKDLVANHAQGLEIVGEKEPLRFTGDFYFGGNGATDPVGLAEEVRDTKGLTRIGVEVALAWTEGMNEDVICYTNGIANKDGGPHLEGARLAVTRAVTDYAKTSKLLKGKEKITGDDTRDGLIMVVNISVPGNILQFESQTKEKLGTTQARLAVQRVLETNLSRWFYDNPKAGKQVIGRMKDASKVRQAEALARQATKLSRSAKRGKKDILDVSTKLVRATAKDPKDRELVLVEGDSAGGSVIKGREIVKIKGKNSIVQAVLPLRGKVMNVRKASLDKAVSNTEISTIISILGTGIGKEFDIEKLQYDKTIILADGDDDGAHIISLIITLFWELMPELIKQGHLYVAQPPLFRFDTYKNGKRIKSFALDNEEYEKVKDNYKGWNVTRLKGLGEMDASELHETVIKRGKRKLIRVTSEHVQESNKSLQLLMGKSPGAEQRRRDWIREVVDFVNESEEEAASLSELGHAIEENEAAADITGYNIDNKETEVSEQLRRAANEDFNYIELSEVLSASMSRYAKASILRAIPDVRDGLKPVHRRVIHTMNTNRWLPNTKHTKMAKVVGAVLAYHPHGDTSVFEAAVPMSQPWSNNVCYLDIDGNNGSPLNNGDWAEPRYIEGRLSSNISLLTSGLKENAVQFVPNYDDTEEEPVVLNAKYPALMTNGSLGQGVGFSTKIAPHNPVELLKAAELLNRKPDTTLSGLMRFVKGPDFPTGGIAIGKEEMKKVYQTGRGVFYIRGRVEIDKNVITITEMPFDEKITRSALIKSIATALSDSPVGAQVKSFNDETLGDDDYCKIVIELDKKANVENFVNFLYEKTALQVKFHANQNAIINREPRLFGLKDYLEQFLDFRRECTRRQYTFEKEKKEARLHIVEGFIKLISTDITDKVVQEIKQSKGTREDAAKAIEKFGFSSAQALAIVAIQLYRLNSQDLERFEKEAAELNERLDFLRNVLENEEAFTEEISRLLKETQKELSWCKRKTEILDEVEKVTVDETDFIEAVDTVVVVKPDGVQRMTSLVYNNNKDKFKGEVTAVLDTDTTKGIALFTRNGQFMQRMAHEVENNSIVNPAEDLHKTVKTFKYDDDIIYSTTFDIGQDTGLEVVSVTAKGQVKRAKLDSSFFAFTQKGYLTRSRDYNGLKIEGDEVIFVDVRPTEEVEKMTLRIVKNNQSRGTLVNCSELNVQGTSGSGVRKINVKPGDTLRVEVKE